MSGGIVLDFHRALKRPIWLSSKPRDPRDLWAFCSSEIRAGKKKVKGVGSERGMIYLGGHKS